MVRIKADKREIELLNLSYETMGIPKNYTLEDDSIVIENNEPHNLDIMTNCVLDTFLKIGLRDDEPNEIGVELDKLNQKLHHVYANLNSKGLQQTGFSLTAEDKVTPLYVMPQRANFVWGLLFFLFIIAFKFLQRDGLTIAEWIIIIAFYAFSIWFLYRRIFKTWQRAFVSDKGIEIRNHGKNGKKNSSIKWEDIVSIELQELSVKGPILLRGRFWIVIKTDSAQTVKILKSTEINNQDCPPYLIFATKKSVRVIEEFAKAQRQDLLLNWPDNE